MITAAQTDNNTEHVNKLESDVGELSNVPLDTFQVISGTYTSTLEQSFYVDYIIKN